MIDRNHPLPISRQAKAVWISRGSLYYLPRPVSDAELGLMLQLDQLALQTLDQPALRRIMDPEFSR